MERLAWEQHALRHKELLHIAEANKVRKIAVARLWRQRLDRAVRLGRLLMTVFHKGRLGRYNRPSPSVQTHRVVRRFYPNQEV